MDEQTTPSGHEYWNSPAQLRHEAALRALRGSQITPEQGRPDRLAEIKQRTDAATPGPWILQPVDSCIHNNETGAGHYAVAVAFFSNPRLERDAAFIAHSRADVDYLIGEVERLRATRPTRGDAVATWLKTLRDQHPSTTYQWQALDSALDDYRLRADYGLSLDASTEGIDGPASALPATPDRGGEKR